MQRNAHRHLWRCYALLPASARNQASGTGAAAVGRLLSNSHMSGLPDHCKLCNATRPAATAAPAAAPSQQGSGRRTCSWRFACTRSTHLQVECDVERVPDGNEGEGDHRGGGLSTHHLGEGAAGSMWSEDAWSTGGQRQEQRWAKSGSCWITRNRTLRCPGSVAPLLVDACALQPGRQPPQERRAAAYKGRYRSAPAPLSVPLRRHRSPHSKLAPIGRGSRLQGVQLLHLALGCRHDDRCAPLGLGSCCMLLQAQARQRRRPQRHLRAGQREALGT